MSTKILVKSLDRSSIILGMEANSYSKNPEKKQCTNHAKRSRNNKVTAKRVKTSGTVILWRNVTLCKKFFFALEISFPSRYPSFPNFYSLPNLLNFFYILAMTNETTTSTNNLQVNLVTPSTETNIVSLKKVHKQYHPEDLVSLAHSIQSSKEFVTQNTMSKLTVIAEQMKALEEQARSILQKAKDDHDLHNIPCNVQKIPGKIYYLWQKPSGEKFFSLIGPEEWSGTKNVHLGTYRFEYDRTFTEEKDFDMIKGKQRLVEGYIGSTRAIEF